MPNRIIKESICTSEEVEQLNAFQETVFYRLIVNCDDFGRMDARAKILKSKLFPLKDVRVETIEAALEALASAELVILYEVDGKPFLQMKTWGKHQQIRAKKSKYPAPVGICDGLPTDDNQGNHLIADDSKCPRNPIQSESQSESETNGNTAHALEEENGSSPESPDGLEEPSSPLHGGTPATRREKKGDDGFEALWAAFPVKYGDIQEAYYEYLGVLQSGVSPEVLIEAAQKQAAVKGRFMPGAAKWLKNKGWTEPAPEPKEGNSVGRAASAGKNLTFMDVLQNRRQGT